MKHLPSAKSPVWQLLIAGHFFAITYPILDGSYGFDVSTYPMSFTIPFVMPVLFVTLIITIIFAARAVSDHNKANPKDRLSIFQVRPPEFYDRDERLSSITAQATKKVYLYHNLALPLLAAAFLLLRPSLPLAFILIGALTMGHYISYWIGIKPALQG